ncbi:MAG: hypothetical protein M0Q52_09120 [Lascolabacillus sp.]|jgi:hypothetical protein|nr:hypothetical protein [Lascolabacillus sp.]
MKEIEISTTSELKLSVQIVKVEIKDYKGIHMAEDEIALCIYGEMLDNTTLEEIEVFNHVTISKREAEVLAFHMLKLSR